MKHLSETYSATKFRGVQVVKSAELINFLFIGVSKVTLQELKIKLFILMRTWEERWLLCETCEQLHLILKRIYSPLFVF